MFAAQTYWDPIVLVAAFCFVPGAAGEGAYLIVATVTLLALLPVVLVSAAPVLPGTGTVTLWKRHLADYVVLPTVIAHLLDCLLINRLATLAARRSSRLPNVLSPRHVPRIPPLGVECQQ